MGKNRSPGEGSIYLDQARGLWRGAVTLADGRRKYFTGRTRVAVAAKVSDATAALRRGTILPDARQTVTRFLDDWLDIIASQVKPRTVAGYRAAVLHITRRYGSVQLGALTPRHVAALMGAMLSEGATPATAAKARSVLRNALGYAVREGTLYRNVAADTPAPRDNAPARQWLDSDGGRRYLAACQDDRDGGFLALVLYLGLRRGEAMGLRWSDYSEAEGLLTVRRILAYVHGGWAESSPKTSSSRRTLPVPPPATAILQAERQRQEEQGVYAPDGPLFVTRLGRHYAPSVIRTAHRRILTAAGLSYVRLHDLRHSTASILLEVGVSARVVADLLGHSSVRTTLGIYSHVGTRLVGEAVAHMAALAPPVAAHAAAQEDADPIPDGATKPATTE